MDEARMKDRNCKFTDAKPAILENWKLVFNKQSQKNPSVGFGNIEPEKGSVVEGVLYTISDDMIISLDKYEGHPKHYTRKKMNVKCDGTIVEADVYIANRNWVKDGLKPTREYLEHFLAEKNFLTESYCENLKKMCYIS